MTPLPPQIGFDRFIKLDWLILVRRIRAGIAAPEELTNALTADGIGKQGQLKTRTKLNNLVQTPRADLANFVERGLGLFPLSDLQADAMAFAWGTALAAYPYFGKVAEFTGRLSSLQGDCSMPEIHRRMSELYGDRTNIKTATRAVIQTQVDWGVIRRVRKGNRVERTPARPVSDPAQAAWLVEAALRYVGKSLELATLQSTATLYPFRFDVPLGYAVLNSEYLEVRLEGPGRQLVALRDIT